MASPLPSRKLVTGFPTDTAKEVGLVGIVVEGFAISMGKTYVANQIVAEFSEKPRGIVAAQLEDALMAATTVTKGKAAVLDIEPECMWPIVAGQNDPNVRTNTQFYFESLIPNEFATEPNSSNYLVEAAIVKQGILGGSFVTAISGTIRDAALDTLEKPLAIACVFSRDCESGAIQFLVSELNVFARTRLTGICTVDRTVEGVFETCRNAMARLGCVKTTYGKIENSICLDLEDILLRYCFNGNVDALLKWCYNNMRVRNRRGEINLYPTINSFLNFFSLDGDIIKYNWMTNKLRHHRQQKFNIYIGGADISRAAEEWLADVTVAEARIWHVAKKIVENTTPLPSNALFAELENRVLGKCLAKIVKYKIVTLADKKYK